MKYFPSEIEKKWPRKRLTSSQRFPSSRSRGASLRGKQEYDPSLIELKWQKRWEETKIYSPNLDKPFDKAQGSRPFYNLMMFPYPSAEGMHVGNMYTFTGADIYGRFKRMQGNDVFEPIGLDGFGIHSENYAIKVGRHPKDQAKISEKNFYRQLRATGNGYDWSRTVETYDPKYYKWTQWLFIQLFKAGLAYRKKAPVNFCPSCKTVLADEQVIDEKCERCSSIVEKRELEQWFFRITKYADRLLNGLNKIDWVEKIKIAQRQWIGKSEGTLIKFKVQPFGFAQGESSKFKVDDIEVFTTRPDTLFGATFLVLSSEHPLVAEILKDRISLARGRLASVRSYLEKAKKKMEQKRAAGEKEKSGVFSGLYAINPVNDEKIPIWIADYVLMGYGTGAIMAVPAHDQRDFEFAKKYGLQIKQVIQGEDVSKKAYVGEGKIINSGDWNGWETPDSIRKVIESLEKTGFGKRQNQYHLRDWLISRQRYWGPPIPMIDCPKCARSASSGQGWQPVPEDQLPVLLPDVKDWKPLGIHSTSSGQAIKSPLANHPEFYKTNCPNCKGPAIRETDVSDTFFDSSWYFLRYLATDWGDIPFPMKKEMGGQVQHDSEKRAAWLPVDMYIGGPEHAVLHLLYSRFITMALHDLGFISFEEPFTRFYAHGLIIKDGAKMSKSKGNVVAPDVYIKKYGADALRCSLMFTGPFNMGGDFRDSGIEGMSRFLKRVWTLVSNIKGNDANPALDTFMHKTIKSVTEDMENLNYNTAISHLMEYYNELHSFYTKYEILDTKYYKTLILLLAPFAPHITEELFQRIRNQESLRSRSGRAGIKNKKETKHNSQFIIHDSIHLQPWPKYDDKFLQKDKVTVAVQVNGKIRGLVEIKNADVKNQKEVEHFASLSANVKKDLDGKKIKKVIYVEGRIINFVLNS